MQHVDLIKFDNMSETALARIIDSSNKSLKNCKFGAKNKALGKLVCSRLANCPSLKSVEFGNSWERVEKVPYELLPSIKHFLKTKSRSIALHSLKVYDCDEELL